MSQAPQVTAAGPAPAPAPSRRTQLLLIPVAVVVLLAIPGGAYAFTQNELGQAQTLESAKKYPEALQHYQSVLTVADNPVSRLLLGETADKALRGAAQTHFEWGQQDQADGKFAEAQTQFQLAVASGIADLRTRGTAALGGLFLAWGDSLAESKKYEDAVDKYRRVGDFDVAGDLKAKTLAGLAAAYSANAIAYTQAMPPDYTTALTWFQDLVKNYPDSPQAKEATANLIPETLFNAGTAFVQASRFSQARDKLNQLVKEYPSSPWAAKATAALSAPLKLSGRLVTKDGTPVPNRLLRLATKWRIVAPHTYDDSLGQAYNVTTDAQGLFELTVPPGQNYLVTWWDPARNTFVTTFVNDSVPVNQITVDPLQPQSATISIN
jgi:tetratricopeptide (TPR) repeat protein